MACIGPYCCSSCQSLYNKSGNRDFEDQYGRTLGTFFTRFIGKRDGGNYSISRWSGIATSFKDQKNG